MLVFNSSSVAFYKLIIFNMIITPLEKATIIIVYIYIIVSVYVDENIPIDL